MNDNKNSLIQGGKYRHYEDNKFTRDQDKAKIWPSRVLYVIKDQDDHYLLVTKKEQDKLDMFTVDKPVMNLMLANGQLELLETGHFKSCQ